MNNHRYLTSDDAHMSDFYVGSFMERSWLIEGILERFDDVDSASLLGTHLYSISSIAAGRVPDRIRNLVTNHWDDLPESHKDYYRANALELIPNTIGE